MTLPETFEAEIAAVERLAPSVRAMRLLRRDGRPLAYEPGQWVNLVLPLPQGEIKRAYSIASAPDGSPSFEIAVTQVLGGPGSSYLSTLGAGHVLKAIGPQGFFTRSATDSTPALFIGTGTGVTPLRSMIIAAVRARASTPLRLLVGVRHEEDLLYRDELERIAHQHPNLQIQFTLSRPTETWTGRRGYVQQHVAELFRSLEQSSGAEPHLYVCGLEHMVSAVRALAKTELGLPRHRIHTERYD